MKIINQSLKSVCFLSLFLMLQAINVYGNTTDDADTTKVSTDSLRRTPRRSISNGDFFDSIKREGISYIPQAPNSAGLVQHIDAPVSYYTGTPEINIPLYEIDIQELKIPISLNYHASGIRLAQEATWVGLGWNLSCGGLVSRTVKCGDDFHEYPSYDGIDEGYLDAPDLDSIVSMDYFRGNLMSGNYSLAKDSEPDVFFYSIPGSSGKFLIDKSRGAVLLKREGNTNVKVELRGSKVSEFGIYTFVIYDTFGNEYTFDQKETTYSYAREGDLNRNSRNATVFDESQITTQDRYEAPFKYTSSWLLTKITTNKGKIINFNYSGECYQLPTQETVKKFNCVSFYGVGNSSPTQIGSNPHYSCSKMVVEGYRLSSVSWDAGSIEFVTSPREDLKEWTWDYTLLPHKLNKLIVRNKNGNSVKQYTFNYEYMDSTSTGTYSHVFKRLMLKSVVEDFTPNFRYDMTYYPGSLPAKNCKNTDIWGYYNGIEQGEEYYSAGQYEDTSFSGADKSSNFESTRIGTIKTISYPTGEVSTFEFEPITSQTGAYTEMVEGHTTLQVYYEYNTHNDDYDFPQFSSKYVNLDNSHTFCIYGYGESVSGVPDQSYMYDSPAFPVFAIYRVDENGVRYDNTPEFFITAHTDLLTGYEHYYEGQFVRLQPGHYCFEVTSPIKDAYFRFTFNNNEFHEVYHTGETVEVGGLRIKEIRGTETRKFSYSSYARLIRPVNYYVYTLSYFLDASNYSTHTYLVQSSESVAPMSTLKDGYIYGYGAVTETKDENEFVTRRYYNEPEEYFDDYPFMPGYLECQNGLLTKETVYKNNSIIQETEYEYASDAGKYHMVYGFIYKNHEANYHPYYYFIYWPHLVNKTTTIHEIIGPRIKEESYSYNDDFQLSRHDLYEGNDRFSDQYLYTGDLNDGFCQAMKDLYIIGVPIERRLLKNNSVIRGVKTNYAQSQNLWLPSAMLMTENESLISSESVNEKYNIETQFTSYTPKGNVQCFKTNMYSTIVLWGYNGMYPIAEIKNCSLQSVKNALGESFINLLETKTEPTESDMAAINNLRSQFPSADITTMTYKPLVGVTSITDGRGFCMHYRYNTSGQLVEEYYYENGQMFILNHYYYHYKNK